MTLLYTRIIVTEVAPALIMMSMREKSSFNTELTSLESLLFPALSLYRVVPIFRPTRVLQQLGS